MMDVLFMPASYTPTHEDWSAWLEHGPCLHISARNLKI